MEKVYKHKKTGEIITYKDGIIKSGNCSIETGVEPSSEFWTELSYKVLETKVYNCQGISNGTYTEITSVKRLSDGEVFSIGDKINFRGLYGNNSEYKYDIIRGFDLKQDANLGILYHNGLVGLSKIEKYKESVFTTFDGVEIFKNQSYWGLYTKTWLLEYVDGGIDYDLEEDGLPDNTYLTFAKKENAEEYILMNKPLLSLNDLLSVWGNDDSFDVYKESPMFQDFKNLAKTKL